VSARDVMNLSSEHRCRPLCKARSVTARWHARLVALALLLFFLFAVPLHANTNTLFELERLDAELLQGPADAERMELLLRRGQVVRSLGRYEEAAVNAREALVLGRALGDPVIEGRARHLMGTVKAEQGELADAIGAFFEAQAVLSETDNHSAYGRSLMAVGVAYVMAEHYQAARSYLEEARELAEEHELAGLKLASVNNLAIVIENVEGPEASLARYREALDLARTQGNELELARILALMCRPLVQTGRLADAESACLEAQSSLERSGNVRLQAGVHLNLAHLRRAQDDMQAVEGLLEQALALAEGRVPTVERDSLRYLSEIYEARGDYRQALEAYRRAESLNRSMLDEERQREIRRLEMQHALEESEREIELLRLDQALSEMRLQRRGWMLWGAGSALLIISFLALMIFRVYRARARRGEELAARDPLTGLLNRRGFEVLAKMEQARGQREGYTKAVAMADIDHFKPINDKYGHAVGDGVLKVISDRLQNNVRGFDSVIRWGGEEFLIFLPRVGEEECGELAERLLAAVTRDPVETEVGPIAIKMTIGIARVTGIIDDAIILADQALYEGKRTGRNRVVVAN